MMTWNLILIWILTAVATCKGHFPARLSYPSVEVKGNNTECKCTFNFSPDTTDLTGVPYRGHIKSVQLPTTKATYRYVHIAPTASKPYILFIHGVPSPFDWRHQIEYFQAAGYGIISPDLRGFGGTDGSGPLEDYRLKTQADEISMLLKCEGISRVIGVSHDYGSIVHSRLANYYPHLFNAHVFIDVGYAGKGALPTLDAIQKLNNQTLQTLGYPVMGYWYFYQDVDAATILDDHAYSAFSMFYTTEPEILKLYFCPVGSFRDWLLQGETAPWGSFITKQEKRIHDRIREAGGGYKTILKTYQALLENINRNDEEMLGSNFTIEKPVLLVTGQKDPVSLPHLQIQGTEPYSIDLRVREVNAGHFLHIEQPNVTNQHLREFFDSVLMARPT